MLQTPVQKIFTDVVNIITLSEGILSPQRLQKYRDELCSHFERLTSLMAFKEQIYESANSNLKIYIAREVTKRVMPVTKAKCEIEASEEYEKKQIDLIQKKYDFTCHKNIVRAIEKKLDSLSSAIRLAEREQFNSKKQV